MEGTAEHWVPAVNAADLSLPQGRFREPCAFQVTAFTVGDRTWGLLITLGFLEERTEVNGSTVRTLRLTERGRRVVAGDGY